MHFDIVTIFPNMFDSPLGESILKRAIASGSIEVHLHDIRQHTTDPHRTVDDTPYGGGAGMVMKPEPLVDTVEAIPERGKRLRVLLTPQGERLSQKLVSELSKYDQLVLICGRYEGIDERARNIIAEKEISIGDYVISGGELAAMVVIDSITRLLPGVLGNADSISEESFEGSLLEYPHFTRPETYRGVKVPDVLRSGNHKLISQWRRQMAIKRTFLRRPELLNNVSLTEEEKDLLKDLKKEPHG